MKNFFYDTVNMHPESRDAIVTRKMNERAKTFLVVFVPAIVFAIALFSFILWVGATQRSGEWSQREQEWLMYTPENCEREMELYSLSRTTDYQEVAAVFFQEEGYEKLNVDYDMYLSSFYIWNEDSINEEGLMVAGKDYYFPVYTLEESAN